MLSAGTHAFAPLSLNHCGSVSNTAIHLIPSQGCQLAAASAAALAKEKEDDAHTKTAMSEEEKATPTNAARELVSRIFNLPSKMKGSTSEPSEISLPVSISSDSEDDSVVYPIVGFTFVKLEGGKMRVVPSMNARGECNIKNVQKSRTEPTYGWFSPCCYLDSHEDSSSKREKP
jgi:hypothetical protein